MRDMPKPRKKLKTHHITRVFINKFNLFKKEILSVNVSKTKTAVFIASILKF